MKTSHLMKSAFVINGNAGEQLEPTEHSNCIHIKELGTNKTIRSLVISNDIKATESYLTSAGIKYETFRKVARTIC